MQDGTLDTVLRRHILGAIEVLDADAAGDEARAARLLRPSMPRLRVSMRDKTHAATRLASKPWAKDASLKEVFDWAVRGSGSITQLIANSPDLKKIFQTHVAGQLRSPVDGRRVRDLQAAKHRFQSTQRPLGRFVLWVDAVLATAHEVQQRRRLSSPQVAKKAGVFLEGVSEERLVLAAMLADGGDEVSGVVRFFDSPNYDAARVTAVLEDFAGKVDSLFLQRRVLSPVSCSYTHHMLGVLAEQRLVRKGQRLMPLGP